jgi:hypothetical protein
MNGGPPVRIGDAERESAAWALGEHYAAGRLNDAEYDERASIAWAARTHADLAPLFSDLPLPHGRPAPASAWSTSQPPPRPVASRPGPRRRPWVPLLLLLVLLAALDLMPLVLIALAVWWFTLGKCSSRHRRVR